MSSIVQQIEKDYIESYKAKNELETSVLRMLKSAIKNAQIEKKDMFNDDVVYKIIIKEVKQRKESSKLYIRGGRQDLADKEQQEIKIFEKYLPAQLTEDEIKNILSVVMTENGLSSPSDFGKIMSLAIPKFSGKADGSMVSSILKSLLSK